MDIAIKEIHRVLKPNCKAHACIVIGDTQLMKVKILNAEVFVKTMGSIGFKLHKVIKRQVPSKILPQTRDSMTGRFTSNNNADSLAYPYEYIVMREK